MRNDNSKPAKLLTTLKSSTARATWTHDEMKDEIWGVGSDASDNLLHKTIERAKAYGSENGLGTIISTTHFRWDPTSTGTGSSSPAPDTEPAPKRGRAGKITLAQSAGEFSTLKRST